MGSSSPVLSADSFLQQIRGKIAVNIRGVPRIFIILAVVDVEARPVSRAPKRIK